jgi:peptidoglycan glycosyltransferase
MLAMFLARFVSTSVIQVGQAANLANTPGNRRALYDSYEIQRGSIIVSGTPIAQSVPSDDVYSWQREYVDAAMWAPVTGYMNPVLDAKTRIESTENSVLSGSDENQFFSRIDRALTGQVPRGSNVELSLDADVQRAAWDALGDQQGAVVAIEPSTGRILAMVSKPSFDTNTLAAHDPDAVNAAYDQLAADPTQPLTNRAIEGNLNPPGSTFKLVVASAALASGRYTPDSTFPNPASYKLAVELGDDAIREEAEKYGFNSAFTMPLTSTPSTYPSTLDAPQTALSGFGQGQVRATPLQMAMVSAGIANGGVVMNPRMIDRVIEPNLSVGQEGSNSEYGRALESNIAAQMVTMMTANVQDGAASNARIDGVQVAGKTGTAENDARPYTLWFTGFAPADDPKVAVAVVVENGGGQGQNGSGNEIAAPIAKKVMEAVLGK